MGTTKTAGSLLHVTATPVGVLSKPEAIIYCGNNTELFDRLVREFGLKPVYKNKTRSLYRVQAIDDRLREIELTGEVRGASESI